MAGSEYVLLPPPPAMTAGQRSSGCAAEGRGRDSRDNRHPTFPLEPRDVILEKGRPGTLHPPCHHPPKPNSPGAAAPFPPGCPGSLCSPRCWWRSRSSSTTSPSARCRIGRPSAVRPPARSTPLAGDTVMWSNCMRFVGDQGLRVRELAGPGPHHRQLERHGEVGLRRRPTGSGRHAIEAAPLRLGDSRHPRGRKAQQIWRPLFAAIEKRWQARFGKEEIDRLGESLRALTSQIDAELPDCLPSLG
jgi:hypothetical protein